MSDFVEPKKEKEDASLQEQARAFVLSEMIYLCPIRNLLAKGRGKSCPYFGMTGDCSTCLYYNDANANRVVNLILKVKKFAAEERAKRQQSLPFDAAKSDGV